MRAFVSVAKKKGALPACMTTEAPVDKDSLVKGLCYEMLSLLQFSSTYHLTLCPRAQFIFFWGEGRGDG